MGGEGRGGELYRRIEGESERGRCREVDLEASKGGEGGGASGELPAHLACAGNVEELWLVRGILRKTVKISEERRKGKKQDGQKIILDESGRMEKGHRVVVVQMGEFS